MIDYNVYFNWIHNVFNQCISWLLGTQIVLPFSIGYLFITVFVFDILIFYIIPSAGVEAGSTFRSFNKNVSKDKK